VENYKILLLMGSASDCDSLMPAVEIFEEFGVPLKVQVASAHRTPERVVELIREAESVGAEAILAAAGMAAHLAGVVSAHTILPVIGIPMESPHLSGLDSLYSTVMMPPGIPVATVGIGKPGAKNAAYLALSILSLKDEALRARLKAFRKAMPASVAEMNDAVQKKLGSRGK
jgi:phosphoribosylaminoimidazole carboxylase PurE protein